MKREHLSKMKDQSFEKLLEAIELGDLSLRNRVVMTAMSTGFAGPDGQVTDRMVEYYAKRAAGGVGLVTVEEAAIHPQLFHIRTALGIYGDHLIPGLKALAGRIHREGAAAAIQIGLYFRQEVSGFPRYGVHCDAPGSDSGCMELTKEEIQLLAVLFAEAAGRARAAGFDAVEIHACHGCLVSQFLSPYWNKRTDEFGGDRSGRFRFALEILKNIRKRFGPVYPVLFRISGSEFVPEGFTLEDALEFSRSLEEEGVTAINVSGGLGHLNHIAIPSSYVPRGILLPLGRAIKDVVRVPVIVGNSLTPLLAKEAIELGQADLIGLGRPLIADPEWVSKVKQGRLKEIRPCIRCNQGCFGGLRDPRQDQITCIYNPLVGREGEGELLRARSKRRIAVIGGGPAGCEVARVCKLRGHEVVLLERMDRLGGQFILASIAPGKEEYRELIDYYEWELARLGVELRLGTEATPDSLPLMDADICVFATGSRPERPPIPGQQRAHVFTAHEVFLGNAEIDKGPVVIVGGGGTGLEAADFLSDRGLDVTVVEMLDTVGRDMIMGVGVRESLLSKLVEKDVELLPSHRAVAILENGVVVSDRPLFGGGHETRIPAGSVVLALGMTPEDTLFKDLSDLRKWHKVGDCHSPGNALEAIHEAFELATRM